MKGKKLYLNALLKTHKAKSSTMGSKHAKTVFYKKREKMKRGILLEHCLTLVHLKERGKYMQK